jgi:hypothetical protein
MTYLQKQLLTTENEICNAALLLSFRHFVVCPG